MVLVVGVRWFFGPRDRRRDAAASPSPSASIIGLTYGLLLGRPRAGLPQQPHHQLRARRDRARSARPSSACSRSKYGLPYYVALPLALLVGGGAGALAEVAVIRRLRNAPRLMCCRRARSASASSSCVFSVLVVNTQAGAGSTYPSASGHAGLQDRRSSSSRRPTPGMLFFGPVVVLGLVWFLKRTRYGLGHPQRRGQPRGGPDGRASRQRGCARWPGRSPAGCRRSPRSSPRRRRGFTTGETFGPGLLLRALAGAVLARMNNFGLALAGGVRLGVTEQLLLWNTRQSGLVEVVLFAIILVALLFQKQRGGRDEEKGSWAAVTAARPVPEALREVWAVRNLGRILGYTGLAVMAVLPAVHHATARRSPSSASCRSRSWACPSDIVTGLGGQLTPGSVRDRRHRRVGVVRGVLAHGQLRVVLPVRRPRRSGRVARHRAAGAAHPRAAADGDDAGLRPRHAGLAAAAGLGAR